MSGKEAKYERLYNQLKPLLENSPSLIAQMSTINAVLYHKMKNFFWVGFYTLNNEKLTVGPYQGPLACQELKYPQGVCWHTIIQKSSQIVPNVEEFPGHIACDSRSKSEIVVPIFNSSGSVMGVLDIDSDKIEQFDELDLQGLNKIISLLKTN